MAALREEIHRRYANKVGWTCLARMEELQRADGCCSQLNQAPWSCTAVVMAQGCSLDVILTRSALPQIIPDVGLCISLLDILDASDGAVLYGDGCYYYKSEVQLYCSSQLIRSPL